MAHIHEDPYININYRAGATIENSFLNSFTLNRIKRAYRPIVILWLGTCELTTKRGKFIRLVEDVETRLLEIERKYSDYKDKILNTNGQSTVIFLECPYFSIPVWNKIKGHYYPECFEEEQILLEKAIKDLNSIFKGLNGCLRVPKLSIDMEFSIKKKRKPRKYFQNYKTLTDGVHPGKEIARLWYLRIIRMISFL